MWVFVALVFASGCAQKDWIDRTLVTVDVTGVWSGSLRGAQAPRDVQLELKQEGSKVTGTMVASRIHSGRYGIACPG